MMNDFNSLPIAVLGHGITGKSLVHFLKTRGLAYEIFDEFARDEIEVIQRHFRPIPGQWVVYSPSFFNSPWLEIAKKNRCRCLQELEFCRQFWEGNCIAVTGTNGKTSTVLLLQHLLRQRQMTAVAVGNIGLPLISQLSQLQQDRNSWAICEISSFQASGLRHFSPNLLLWTNFAPNHLNCHGTLEAYFRAKWNLATQTRQCVLYDESVEFYRRQFHLNPLPTATVFDAIAFANGHSPSSLGEKNPAFDYEAQRKNLQMVAKLLELGGIMDDLREEDLTRFHLPPHRLHCFHHWNSHRFWNDSKATNAAAAESALRHMRSQTSRLIWITGGQSKGESLENFRSAVNLADDILVLGEISKTFLAHFPKIRSHPVPQKEMLFPLLQPMLADSKQRTDVVFSPGFASFDQFSSYTQRGEWFESQTMQYFSR